MITLIANGDPLSERWSDAARAASLAARRATGSLTDKKAAARAAYGPRKAGPITRMVRIYRQSKHHARTAHALGLQLRTVRHPGETPGSALGLRLRTVRHPASA